MFGFSGAATLRIESTSGEVVASARTYNDQPQGTYGQFIAGAPESTAIAYGQQGLVIQLAQSSSDASGFRTNIGVVNVVGTTLTVEAGLYRGDGTLLGTKSFSLPAYGYQQADRIFRSVISADVVDGFAVLSTPTTNGKFFAYASVVDNRSGDPVYMPANSQDTPGGGGDEITIALPGGVPLVLVKIPHGTFTMGSLESERGRDSSDEGPQHQVTLTQDYYIGKYEVTQRQWVAVMGSNPSSFTSCGLDCPVEQVSWSDICGGSSGADCTSSSFIGKVNQLLGTTKFRLPTEAEWERAARAETTTEFSFPAPADWDMECGGFPEALPYMWWCNNSGSTTHAVGQKQPNPYGLYDIQGNVWELVGDWYGSYSSASVTDPQGPNSGSYRVIRGGSWANSARHCRMAYRSYSPGDRYDSLGFRLVRSQ